MTPRTNTLLGAGAAVVAIAIAGGVYVASTGGTSDASDAAGPGSVATAGPVDGPPDATLPEVDTAGLVAGIAHASDSTIEPVRLAEGLVPPTNRWFSGLVFGDEPQPVFPLPLSFALTDDGFSIGMPNPVTSAAAIISTHLPAVAVTAGASSARISAYDAVSVTIELLDAADVVLGRVVIAEGSPFVSFTAVTATTLTLGAPFAAATDGPATATVEGTEYALVAPDGAVEGSEVRLEADESATWYAVPEDADPAGLSALATAAADPVVGSEITYGVGDGIARTTIGYLTAAGTPSAYVTMPHHRTGTQPERTDCGLGSYRSVYGTLDLCAGSTLTSWAPELAAAGALDLSAVSDERREVIVGQLAKDVEATGAFASDTYFGGKNLYRAATLVTLGESLGADDVVAPLRETVAAALREWAEPDGCTLREMRCFVYDEDAHGIVGRTVSFGSEEFNDHHFHYGYHLAAAGLLAADDSALASDLAPVMNLLAQDIAAASATEWFPQLRTFDVYAGHAWASGTVPFADANNQESSSEAVSAWNGLGLWAQASGQGDLEVQASWLASTEAASARAYWTDVDLTDPVFEGFDHEIIALNWGGKRDYATWFSAEPSAILGILLIPMSPAAGYLAGDPDRIRANVAEAAPGGYDVQFGDYLLMYLALAGTDDAETAWTAAQSLPDTSVDDGDSRAYMLAWIAAAASGTVPSGS